MGRLRQPADSAAARPAVRHRRAGSTANSARLCRRGAARDRLFAAFLAEIESPAALTVAVIEDAHWADEATIDLLSFLGRRLGRMTALVLVTYRDDELADDHPLRMVLGDLATQRSTRRMRLPPLSVEAVRTLVGQRDVDPAELHRVTGGNPFYVSRSWRPGGHRSARRCATWWRRGWPGRRPAPARGGAGGGGDRDPGRTAAAGVGAGRTADSAVDECLASGILVADGTGLRFRHELVRMAVAEALAPHRRAELHERLLAALEERGGADPARAGPPC